MSVCCECCVLSGRGLCNELITHPEEPYWLWCVVLCDPEIPWMRRSWPTGVVAPKITYRTRRRHQQLEITWRACHLWIGKKNVRVVSSYEYEWGMVTVSCIWKHRWVAGTDVLGCNGRHCAELSEVVPVTKHQVMKAYGGVAVNSTPYLIPTVDGNERFARVTTNLKIHESITIESGGLVGPRALLDPSKLSLKIKIFYCLNWRTAILRLVNFENQYYRHEYYTFGNIVCIDFTFNNIPFIFRAFSKSIYKEACSMSMSCYSVLM